jgi:hypothetical protein
MRHLTTIELTKLSTHIETLKTESKLICYEGKIEYNHTKIQGNKTAIQSIIKKALKVYEQCSIELFGKPDYESHEIADRNYLQSFL